MWLLLCKNNKFSATKFSKHKKYKIHEPELYLVWGLGQKSIYVDVGTHIQVEPKEEWWHVRRLAK